jgi:hypothetical protein
MGLSASLAQTQRTGLPISNRQPVLTKLRSKFRLRQFTLWAKASSEATASSLNGC